MYIVSIVKVTWNYNLYDYITIHKYTVKLQRQKKLPDVQIELSLQVLTFGGFTYVTISAFFAAIIIQASSNISHFKTVFIVVIVRLTYETTDKFVKLTSLTHV